jgi:hypothetical protein
VTNPANAVRRTLAGQCLCGAVRYAVTDEFVYAANCHCSNCRHVAMGTLIDDPAIRPTKHIFVGSKAPWFKITDDLPQYDEHVVVAAPAGG